MMQMNFINDGFAVSEQISPEDIATIKENGFTAIVCNRPDGEAEGQPTSDAIKSKAEESGLSFTFIPMVGPNFTSEDVAQLKKVVAENDKVFAYCRTGNRSSILFNASQE